MKKIISSCSVKYSESIQNAFKSLLADTAIGFTRIPERLELFSESEKLAAEMSQKFEQFLVVGIGGSSMGARALVEISGRENIHFLDNVDAAEFSRIWNKIQPKLNRTGILVVSKSGSTVEILWNYTQLEALAKKQNVVA